MRQRLRNWSGCRTSEPPQPKGQVNVSLHTNSKKAAGGAAGMERYYLDCYGWEGNRPQKWRDNLCVLQWHGDKRQIKVQARKTVSLTATCVCGLSFLLLWGIIKFAHPLAENAHPHDISLNNIKVKNGKGYAVTIFQSLQSLLSLNCVDKSH